MADNHPPTTAGRHRSRETDPLIVTVARRWAPFGAVPGEEILVTFGISEQVFYERLRSYLKDDSATAHIPDDERKILQRLPLRPVPPRRSIRR